MIQVYPKCHFCNKIKDTYLQLFISIPTWLPIFFLGLNHIWREFSQIPFYGATRKLFIISLEPTVQNSLGSLLYTTCQSVVHYDVLAAKSIDTGGYHPIDAGRLEVPGYLNGNYHRDFSQSPLNSMLWSQAAIINDDESSRFSRLIMWVSSVYQKLKRNFCLCRSPEKVMLICWPLYLSNNFLPRRCSCFFAAGLHNRATTIQEWIGMGPGDPNNNEPFWLSWERASPLM